jgi:hypothetical protein
MPSPERSDPHAGAGAGVEVDAGQADRCDSTAVLGLPEGPCNCCDLPDYLDRPEPVCDRARRRLLTRRRLAELERWSRLARVWGASP